MKTIRLLFAAAFLLSLFSCTKEFGFNFGRPEFISVDFEASSDSGDGKTALFPDATGGVCWTAGEKISVHYYDDANICKSEFLSQNADTVAATTFKGQILRSSFFSPIEKDSTAFSYFAIYPYNEDNEFDGNNFIFRIQKEQLAQPDNFAQGQFPMIARTTNHILSFYQVSSGICFTVVHPNIKTVRFSANGGESIAGIVKAEFSNNVPSSQVAADESSAVFLSAPQGSTLIPGKKYYVALHPATLSTGISVSFITESTKADTCITKATALSRRVFKQLYELDKGLDFSVRVMDLELDTLSIVLPVDGNYQLNATIKPADAQNKGVVWQSSDPAIADVSAEGIVTAKSKGHCMIVACSAENEQIRDTCMVQVYKPLKSIELKQKDIEIPMNQKYEAQLKVSLVPEDAEFAELSWHSSNPQVAEVDQDGKVTPKSVGECTITVSSKSNPEISDVCNISVFLAATSINIIGDSELDLGSTMKLSVETLPEAAKYKGVIWKSLNEDVATVSADGTVTSKSEGVCRIVAENEKDSTVRSELNVKVVKVIKLDKDGTYANCYILSSSGTYDFAAVKGVSGASLGAAAYSVKVLWENKRHLVKTQVGDLISSAQLKNGRVRIVTPVSLQNGNALVAVLNSSGTVLWSWHIWIVRGYDIDASAQVYSTGDRVMDRHLGATCTGDINCFVPMYQWGRKDPFLPGGAPFHYSSTQWPDPIEVSAATGSISYAVANPMTFITSGTSGDWNCTSSEIASRWLDDKKTDYDPCPYGWRVPTGGEKGFWNSASQAESTYTWDYNRGGADLKSVFAQPVETWYQCTGYYTSAYVFQAGTYLADFWTTTSYANFFFDMVMSYSSTKIRTGTTKAGSCGLAVRCIKENK